MIEIKLKNELYRGQKQVRVLKISALKESELPYEYTDGVPMMHMMEFASIRKTIKIKDEDGEVYFMEENRCYGIEYMAKLIGIIRRAGIRLKKINESLRPLMENWNGRERTIKI
jgi:hypothetical protein